MADGTKMAIPKKPSLKYLEYTVEETPPDVILEQIYDTWEEAEKLREIMADGTKMAIPKKPSLKYLEYTVEEVEV